MYYMYMTFALQVEQIIIRKEKSSQRNQIKHMKIYSVWKKNKKNIK